MVMAAHRVSGFRSNVIMVVTAPANTWYRIPTHLVIRIHSSKEADRYYTHEKLPSITFGVPKKDKKNKQVYHLWRQIPG
jgi:hypothetical protein